MLLLVDTNVAPDRGQLLLTCTMRKSSVSLSRVLSCRCDSMNCPRHRGKSPMVPCRHMNTYSDTKVMQH